MACIVWPELTMESLCWAVEAEKVGVIEFLHVAGISILLPFSEEWHSPTPLCPPTPAHTHTDHSVLAICLALLIFKY